MAVLRAGGHSLGWHSVFTESERPAFPAVTFRAGFSCIHALVYCGHLLRVVSLGGVSPSLEGLLMPH